MLDGNHYIECLCSSDEHMIRITIDKDDEFPRLYVHYFLEDMVWHERLWLGIRYIFGYKCKYGHFGETVWAEEEIKQVRQIFEEFER